MKQTPYYRSLTSIVSFLAGGAVGVAASTLFNPPPGRTRRVKIQQKVRETVDEAALALDAKQSQS
jgi:gas vesicle protein